jgi:type II secretory pathway component PulF
VKPPPSSFVGTVFLFTGFGGEKQLQKIVCSYLDIFKCHFFCMFYVFCFAVYIVYIMVKSPNFAASNLYMLKRLPVYDKVVSKISTFCTLCVEIHRKACPL